MAWIQYTISSIVIYDDSGRVLTSLPLTATGAELSAAFGSLGGSTQDPDWSTFLQELLQSPMLGAAQLGAQAIIGAELPAADGERRERLLRANTALASLPAVLLAAASPGGDPGLFVGAWLILRQASLVSPEIAAAIAQLAVGCHLPEELVRSLGAPGQPP
jgi:hypothetical protein